MRAVVVFRGQARVVATAVKSDVDQIKNYMDNNGLEERIPMCYDVSEGSRAGKSKNSAVVKSMRNYNHSKLICFAIRKKKISNFFI